MIYNPNENFKPNIAGNHAIKGQLVDDYWDLVPVARRRYKEKLEKFGQKEIIKEIIVEVEAKKEDRGENVNTVELDKLKKELAEKEQKIRAQAEKIAALSTNGNEKIRHEKFPKIIGLLERKQAVYLHGPAGTGKSELAKEAAKELELDFYPASTITQEFKLTGFEDGHGIFHDTNFYKAIKNGGLFFLDEMDSCTSEVLVGINGALANGYFDFPHETLNST